MTDFRAIDWRQEWIEQQKSRRRPDGVAFWDERATSFAKRSGSAVYVRQFIEFMQLEPGQTVLDMGCGSGTLAIPLAEQGHTVLAADFSKGMLSELESVLAECALTTVSTRLLSWEDDWHAAGIESKSVDVAIASRSMVTSDLGAALLKLNDVARSRVCVSLATSGAPRNDSRIYDAVGRRSHSSQDLLYCVNILFQMGINPEFRSIDSGGAKKDHFTSYEDAFERSKEVLQDTTPQEEELLARYLKEHLVPGEPKEDGAQEYELDSEREIIWAFISWTPTDVL